MARSGFVPAWMKIQSSDTINQRVTSNSSENNSTASSPIVFPGRQRHHSSEIFDHLTKNFESNGFRSTLNSSHRLHSVSSSNSDQISESTRKLPKNEQNSPTPAFDQDFPSLNGREKNSSSSSDHSTSIWNNAASKFRVSHHSRPSNRLLMRKDRLLTSPNMNRSLNFELQTNCITQTKNLDKRSDFLNSLKNDSTKPGEKRSFQSTNPKCNSTIIEQPKISKGILRLFSVPETAEEKDLLIRMGWNESDEITYEITDQDKQDYEKRLQLSPRNDNSSAALMLALRRRTLPCLDHVEDLFRWEQIASDSDDESSFD